MGIPFLYELRNEIKRLSIAGSNLSSGDYGLKKLLPEVRLAGKSAPVFNRMADTMESLIDRNEGASEKLLELITLVNAVLYTQGQCVIEGDFEEIETTPARTIINASHRDLAPVFAALKGTGSGRLDTIIDAYRRGLFNDLRLILPSIEALDDSNPEIVNFIYEKVLLGFGPAVLPTVKDTLDLGGGRGHGKRVEFISHVGGLKERSLYLDAIEKGSQDVKIKTIKALEGDDASLDLLLDLTRDKKQEVRKAALEALSTNTSDKVSARLFEVFCGKDLSLAVSAIRKNTSKELALKVLQESESLVGLLLHGAAGTQEMDKLFHSLICLENKNYPHVIEFLENSLIEKDALYRSKFEPVEGFYGIDTPAKLMANTLLSLGNNDVFQFLEDIRDKHEGCLIGYSLQASLMIREPDYVFEKYSPYISPSIIPFVGKDKNGDVRSDILTTIERTVKSPTGGKVVWDTRWVKIFVKLDEEKLVRYFLRLDSKLCMNYFVYKVKQKQNLTNSDTVYNLLALHNAGYPGIGPLIMDTLIKTHSSGASYYCDINVKNLLMTLSSKYAKEIEDIALAEGSSPSVRNTLFDIANYIKNKDRKE